MINGVYIGGVMFLLYRSGILLQSRKLIESFLLNSAATIHREIAKLFDYVAKKTLSSNDVNYIYRDICGKNTKIDSFMR